MDRATLKDIPLDRKPFSGLGEKVHRILFLLFLALFIFVWTRLWLPHAPFPEAGWPEGLLVVFTSATLLASLSQNLPGQNVMLACAIIGTIGSIIIELTAATGLPLGPIVFTGKVGQRLFHELPWVTPLLWIIFILSSRGVARLALRPWRHLKNYGFWVIGLATALTVWLDLGLEPFATRAQYYWRWNATRVPFDWYGTPWVNFLGWALTALLILMFATPSLVNKRPVTPPPPGYHPLIVWLLLNLLFATGCATHQLWFATALISAGSLVTLTFAIHGARW